MERRGPSHSGPLGLACTNCFKAKCKCVARPDGAGCQRCYRLNKTCKQSDSLRRRTITKEKSSTGRIADLENKLDGLISQLQFRKLIDGDGTQQEPQEPPAPQEPPSQAVRTASIQPSDRGQNDTQTGYYVQDGDDGQDDSDDNLNFTYSIDSPSGATRSKPSEPQLSDEEAETRLYVFRSCMLNSLASSRTPSD